MYQFLWNGDQLRNSFVNLYKMVNPLSVGAVNNLTCDTVYDTHFKVTAIRWTKSNINIGYQDFIACLLAF